MNRVTDLPTDLRGILATEQEEPCAVQLPRTGGALGDVAGAQEHSLQPPVCSNTRQSGEKDSKH